MAFSIDKAKKLCRAAGAAYGNDQAWQNELRLTHPNFTLHTHLTHGAQCIVAGNSADVIISFRGTSTVTDILSDLTILPAGGIHAGFKAWVETLRPEIEENIVNLFKSGRKTVHITGHSLGGCMAQIYARLFVERFEQTPIVYAFSSPACFTAEVASNFDALIPNSWRVYAEEDPFVFALNAIYTHTRKVAELNEMGQILFEPTSYVRYNVTKHSVSVLYQYLVKAGNTPQSERSTPTNLPGTSTSAGSTPAGSPLRPISKAQVQGISLLIFIF